MAFSVRYKPLAATEVENAIRWYSDPNVNQGAGFVTELERAEARIASHPELYQRVEGDVRRAVLRRFPYSLFYIVQGDVVLVLACMHHHQKPRSQNDLV